MSDLDDFRKQKDDFFRQSPQSPLSPQQQADFDGLRYFPENPGLDLEVDVSPFDEQQTIQMQTTTGDVQTYERYGRFAIEVDGQTAELTVYHNQHGYFLPFVDSLRGDETYGAGRYLEPEPLGGDRFQVDFNYAYNPYCAYNDAWSCPITPAENRIQVPIRAGEKVFHDPEG
jgi:uncharacterized protein (DUF1684 family)